MDDFLWQSKETHKRVESKVTVGETGGQDSERTRFFWDEK